MAEAAAAAAAVAVDPLDEIRTILQGPLGMTPGCANRFLTIAGITGMADFRMLRPSDASTIIKRHNEANNTTATRSYNLGITYQKKLQGFLYWYHDKFKRGLDIVSTDFTSVVMYECMAKDHAETVAQEVEQKELNPGPIETGAGYFDWSERAVSAFLAMRGKSGDGPLYRVIRDDQPPDYVAPNPTLQLCYDLPLTGIGFDLDNQQVFQNLQRWTIKNPIYTWIKKFENTEDGRGAWFALKEQLEGKAAINGRTYEAMRIIGTGEGSAVWTNEYGYKFVDYTTQLQLAYSIFEKCDKQVTPDSIRVRRMLDGMKPNDKQVAIQIAKSYVADNLLGNWIGACQYLQAKIDEAFPPKAKHGQKRGYRKVSQTGSAKKGGKGAKKGKGGNGGGNKNVFNGVDISDHCRKFSDKEFKKMGHEGRIEVFQRRHNDKSYAPGAKKYGDMVAWHKNERNERAVAEVEVRQSDDASAITNNSRAIVQYNGSNASNQDRNRGGNNADAIGDRSRSGPL